VGAAIVVREIRQGPTADDHDDQRDDRLFHFLLCFLLEDDTKLAQMTLLVMLMPQYGWGVLAKSTGR
jgi:hypothetical protein